MSDVFEILVCFLHSARVGGSFEFDLHYVNEISNRPFFCLEIGLYLS